MSIIFCSRFGTSLARTRAARFWSELTTLCIHRLCWPKSGALVLVHKQIHSTVTAAMLRSTSEFSGASNSSNASRESHSSELCDDSDSKCGHGPATCGQPPPSGIPKDSQIGSEGDESGNDPSPKSAPESRSRKEQFKQAVKDYGVVVVVFHIALTLASLAFFYILVSSGLDVVELLRKIGIGENLLGNQITKGASTFLMAYAIHKLFVPARMAITLAATPIIVGRLRKLGFFKKIVEKNQ